MTGVQTCALPIYAIDWLTMTPNLGLETRLSPRFSLDISVAVNPFDVSIMDVSNRNMRIQPELRYWFNRPMARHYMGLALLGGFYDTKIRSRIYEGDIIAGGLTYGYALVLSRHWNVEFTAGIGVGKMRALTQSPSWTGDWPPRHKCPDPPGFRNPFFPLTARLQPPHSCRISPDTAWPPLDRKSVV